MATIGKNGHSLRIENTVDAGIWIGSCRPTTVIPVIAAYVAVAAIVAVPVS